MSTELLDSALEQSSAFISPEKAEPVIDFERTYTVEEFLKLQWPDDDNNEYELIRGKLVACESPGPSAEHGEIVTNLSSHLNTFATANEDKVGKVYGGSACTLGRPKGSNYVVPDVAFVAAGRTPPKFTGPVPVAPDLVVEVNSPSDTLERIHDKIEAYHEAGVRLVWSIYALDEYILVHRPGNPKLSFLSLEDELDGEDVLPGFKLKVKILFE